MLLQLTLPLILSLVGLLRTIEAATQFVEEPKSQNVSLGSSVVFNCTGYSLGHHWLVNGELTESEDNKNRGFVKEDEIVNDDTNLKIHLLTVPATMMNDGITVVCYIYTQMTIASDTAVLQIQGLLAPVTDVESTWINSSSFEVMFDPPYTLDGVPIINYTVEVVIHDSLTSVYNTDETEIVLSGYNICNNHTIILSAWNDVGKGENKTFFLNQGLLPPSKPLDTIISIQYSPRLEVILQTIVNNRCSTSPDSITVFIRSSVNTDLVAITANCEMKALTCDNEAFVLSKSVSVVDYVDMTVNMSAYVAEGYQYNVSIVLANSMGNESTDHFLSIPSSTSSTTKDLTSTSKKEPSRSLAVSNAIRSTKGSSSSFAPPSSSNRFDQPQVDGTSDAASWMPEMVIALCVSSGSLVILSLVIVMLMMVIMKYKKKNSNLKFAEMDARLRQRNAEVVLNTLTTAGTINSRGGGAGFMPTPIETGLVQTEPNGYYESPTTGVVNPQYENLEDVQLRLVNEKELHLVNCPAYATLPTQPDCN